MFYRCITLILFLICDIESKPFKQIQISDENISTLTREYFQKYENLGEILKLEITNSGVNTIETDAFEDFTSLISLNLLGNNIREVNFSIKTLQYLILRNNNLKNAPDLEKFPKLLNLYLENNKIKRINYNSKTHKLDNLELSENPIREINISLNYLSDIEIMNSDFSEVIFNLDCPSLKTIDTSQILLTPENINTICRYNSPVIYMNFDGSTDMNECSTREDKEQLSSKEQMYNSKSVDRIEEDIPNVKEGNVKTTISDKDYLDNIVNSIQQKNYLIAILIIVIILTVSSLIFLIIKITNCNNNNNKNDIYLKPGTIKNSSSRYQNPPKIINEDVQEKLFSS